MRSYGYTAILFNTLPSAYTDFQMMRTKAKILTQSKKILTLEHPESEVNLNQETIHTPSKAGLLIF